MTKAATAATDERASSLAGSLVASVVVPARNAGSDLRELLVGLERQTIARDRFEVIIADDGSTDGCAEGLARDDDLVRVLPAPPLNVCVARNRAARAARASVLAFIDADCRPEPQWLEAGLSALRAADVVGGLIRFVAPERPTIWSILEMELYADQERDVKRGTAITGNLFVRREVYERVGGFDEAIPMTGDQDFVSRCVANGARLVLGRDALVWHPARNRARPLLRKLWQGGRCSGRREARKGRRPSLRRWIPIVPTVVWRKRTGRSLFLDHARLEANGIVPTRSADLKALPLLYLVVPYIGAMAELLGWWETRRRR